MKLLQNFLNEVITIYFAIQILFYFIFFKFLIFHNNNFRHIWLSALTNKFMLRMLLRWLFVLEITKMKSIAFQVLFQLNFRWQFSSSADISYKKYSIKFLIVCNEKFLSPSWISNYSMLICWINAYKSWPRVCSHGFIKIMPNK